MASQSATDYTADPALYNVKLVEALHAGDKEQLRRLVQAQAARDDGTISGSASITSVTAGLTRQSPLHIAVQIVPLDLVRFLLTLEQLDVNQRDVDGNTPLHLAAKSGRIDVVRELLEKGDVDISLRNDADQLALDIARDSEIIDALQDYQQMVVNQLAPQLHQYAAKGDLEQVKRLFDDPRVGAVELNHQNPMTGSTLLHEAVLAGSNELVRYLLNKGVDPFIRDRKGKTALELTKADSIKAALKEAFNDVTVTAPLGEVPRMQGSLYKWTNFASGYKLRYFVLENGILSYYKNQEEAGNACRGSVNISTANIWMHSSDKNRFDIVGKGSVRYHLRSEHAAEAKRWILALTQTKQGMQGLQGLQSMTGASGTSSAAVGTPLRTPNIAVAVANAGLTPLSAPIHTVGSSLDVESIVGSSTADRRRHSYVRASSFNEGTASIAGTSIAVSTVESAAESAGTEIPYAANNGLALHSGTSPQVSDDSSSMNGITELPHGDQLVLAFQSASVQLDVQQQLLASIETNVRAAAGEESDVVQRSEALCKGMRSSLDTLRRLQESARNMSEDREAYWRARCEAEAERQRLWESSLKQVVTEREEMLETITSVKNLARRSGAVEVAAAIEGSVDEVAELEELEEEDEFYDATEEGFNFEEALSGEAAASAGTTSTPPRTMRSLSLAHLDLVEKKVLGAEETAEEVVAAAIISITTVAEAEAQFNAAFIGYPAEASGFRSCLPPPDSEAPAISIWSVLKNSIGKDLTKISMPVMFNEPTSMLQRMCEDIEYIDLLDTAVLQRGSSERMLYVAAFAISNYSSTLGRIAKPFNPLLGETFEYVRPDKQYRYVSEQVSHHPPISACHCDSPNYAFFAEVNVRSKFMGNTLEMHPSGVTHLVLKVPPDFVKSSEQLDMADAQDEIGRVDEHYSWTKCITAVNNLILGRLTIEHYGEMPITNHLTGETCMLTFKQRGWRGKDEHVIEGTLSDTNGRPLYEIWGKWSDKFIARRVAEDDVHIPAPSADSTSFVSSAGGGKGRSFILWRKTPTPETPRPFNMTEFAASLNECSDELRPYIAPTDSRIRPDQHALERGEWELASQEKNRLEEKQRAKRRERETEDADGTYRARWFVHDVEPDTGEGYWRFNHEYWTERAKAAAKVQAGEKPQWKGVEDIF